MTIQDTRCGCCDARGFGETDRRLTMRDGTVLVFTHACNHCGLLVADGLALSETIGEQITAAIARSEFHLPAFGRNDRRWGMDIHTLRTAATRRLRRTTPMDGEQTRALKAPHGSHMARALLDDLPSERLAELAIAVLCREEELDLCRERAAAWLGLGWEILILVDAAPTPSAPIAAQRSPTGGTLRIERRPLAGDFAAQRNVAQAKASRSWILQLDADETLDETLLQSLGGLISMAERDGILSIGFPRRNWVDGVLSDLYPDVQYRLNHASVRYGGRAHERPILPGGWRQSFIALSGAIDHHLSADHVATRSLRYEALAPGQGRLEEARLLMEPYRP